jgi:radical SAM superfamily enzyme YgiQ (UPF0313 family)
MKFLFIHSWQGFCLAEWYLREAISNYFGDEIHFESIDIPSNGIPANDTLQRIVFSWGPDIIGFSCHYWSIAAFFEASDWIKKTNPKAFIVLGGPQVNSINSAQIILESYKSIDFIIRGSGEESICKLIESFNLNKSRLTVPGLSFRDNGVIVHNKIINGSRWPKNLIFHQGNAKLTNHILALHEVSFETTRGCYSKCIYCYYPIDNFEIIDDEKVFSELLFICNSEVENLRICDTHFGGTKERAKKILRYLKKINHHTSVKIYPNLLHIDEEYIQLIKESGAQITSIGIQSTNLVALKKINRNGLHSEDRKIQLILNEFPDVPADLIVGLPGDSLSGLKKSFQETLSLGFSNVNIFRLMVFPGTTLSEKLTEYYDSEKIVISTQGQLIYSTDFPVKDQKKISNYIYALEIICWILRNQKVDITASERVSKFNNMTNKLNSDQLLDLFRNISLVNHSKNANMINQTLEGIELIFKKYDI